MTNVSKLNRLVFFPAKETKGLPNKFQNVVFWPLLSTISFFFYFFGKRKKKKIYLVFFPQKPDFRFFFLPSGSQIFPHQGHRTDTRATDHRPLDDNILSVVNLIRTSHLDALLLQTVKHITKIFIRSVLVFLTVWLELVYSCLVKSY